MTGIGEKLNLWDGGGGFRVVLQRQVTRVSNIPMTSKIPTPRFFRKTALLVTTALGMLISGASAGESYIAAEAYSGKILLELDADQKRPVASLTKIATAVSYTHLTLPTTPYV